MDLLNVSVLLLLCSALSFLFSGMEAGFLALDPIRIRRLAKSQHPAAARLKKHLDSPETFLWTILVGNTTANLGFVVLVVYLLWHHASFPPAITWGLSLVLLFAFYAFLDLLPKMLIRRFPNRLTILFTYPFEIFFTLVAPILQLLSRFKARISKQGEDFSASISPFQNRRDLERIMMDTAPNLRMGERNLITRVLDLENQNVGSVMNPFDTSQTLSSAQTVREAIALCKSLARTRLIVRNGPHTSGVFHLKRSLFADEDTKREPVSQHITTPLFLSTQHPLDTALQKMKISGERLAIVVDSERNELGVISLTDILFRIFHEMNLRP